MNQKSEVRIPRKWKYIADQLRILNAPRKVINAAVEIDNAMVRLGMGYSTKDWATDYHNRVRLLEINTNDLFSIIMNEYYCTACELADDSCVHCKLGDIVSCTPRSRFADLYFTIVRRWVEKQINRDV